MGKRVPFTAGKYRPIDDGIRIPEGGGYAPCLNCAEEFTDLELVTGWCFECRLERAYTRRVPLDIRPGYGAMIDLKF
jgi:hypothetical protein